ncbi:MAG: hypothetical protein ACJ762_10135 [Solirubrobacteraceae bacterium]
MFVVAPDAGRGAALHARRMDAMNRLVLEIEHGNDAPSGWLHVAGIRHPFRGYAELVSELQRVRSSEITTEGGTDA